MRRILAVCLLVALALSTGVAAASSGSLTRAEYQQLKSAMAREKASRGGSLKAAQRQLWDCEQIQMETPLLTEERASCDGLLGMSIAAMQLAKKIPGCVSHNATPLARFGCILRLYNNFYTATDGVYQAEKKLRQIVRGRGFDAQCTAFLATTPEAITLTGRLTSEARELITELRSDKLTQFKAVSQAVGRDMTKLGRALQVGPSKVSVCPHR